MITFNKNMNFSSNKVCKLLEDKKLLEILNTSGKSTVWQKFLYLNHIKSKDCIGYVICKTCKQALKHYKSTSGTTHLNDHLKRGTCKYYRSRMEPHEATSYTFNTTGTAYRSFK